MTDQAEDDIVLAELPDDELVDQMWDDLYDGLAEEMIELGFTIEGKSLPSVELIKMAVKNIAQGASQLRSALEAADGADARFFAQIVAEVCGASETGEKLLSALNTDAALMLDED